MIFQIEKNDYPKVSSLIKNTKHELSIQAVIAGNAPGEIYVDNPDAPLSTLIIAPECKVVAGKADNKLFNQGVKSRLGFFDQITCDDEGWEESIHQIHSNIAIRKYRRRYYQFDQLKYKDFSRDLDLQYVIEYVDVDSLERLEYENSDKIRNWFHFMDINRFKDYCLGSFIRKGNQIVSWCLVDCIVDNKIEIGVTTETQFKKKGLAAIATAATVYACTLKGIKEIGWHCVDTNVGSIRVAEKVGFKKVREYASFTPFPPVENVTDLNSEQWSEWARYYEEMNKIQPSYYWLAATCWAKSCNMEKTLENLTKLAETGETWFVKHISEMEEFSAFKENDAWIRRINHWSMDREAGLSF